MKNIKEIFQNRKISSIIILAVSVTLILVFCLSFYIIKIKNDNKNNFADLNENMENGTTKNNNNKITDILINTDEKKSENYLENNEKIDSSKKKNIEVGKYSKAVLSVQGLSCSSCVQEIKNALSSFNGINNILVDVGSGTAQIYFDNNKIKSAQIIAERITSETGYPAAVVNVLNPDKVAKEKQVRNEKKEIYIVNVGGWEISREEFNIELEAAKIQYKNRYGNDVFTTPNGINLENSMKVQVVDRLIDEGIMLQDISKAGYKVSMGIVEREFNNYLKKSSLNISDLRGKLKVSGYSYEYFKKKFANNVLINKYLDDMIFTKAVTDAQKQNLYNGWYNNIKALVQVVYYDTDLEQLVTSAGSVSGGCCP